MVLGSKFWTAFKKTNENQDDDLKIRNLAIQLNYFNSRMAY